MANISRIKLDETTYELKDAQAARASDLDAKQDALTAGDGIAIDSNNIIRTTGIPFGVVDSTSTSTAYTVTVPGIYKLEEGVCCLVKNGKVTSESGFTLNVNGLGAKPSYSNMATGNTHTPTAPTRDTTIFNINYTMLFIYTTSLPDVPNGAWICYRGYDANTNTIGYQVRSNSHSLPASQKFYRYRLLFTSADGTHYVPANTSSSTNATASRTVNQTPIDPFGHIVYYGTTAAVEANARPAASSLWVIYTLSLGYSFNRTGAALNLTSWKPVYIKCAPQSNGSAIIDADTPYVQALPTTNDGKIYIFLGVAYNATSIELLNSHPVYYHDGTGIRVWTGKKIATKVSELTNDSGFITSSSLNGYATESYVDNKVPFIANVTISTNPSTGTVTASSITTHAQIKEAVAAGRSVYVKTSIGTVLHLMHINNDEAHFSIVGESSGWKMQQISCTSSNVWSVVNSGLAAVATSGSYNDLTDQPNIPSIAGLATETYVNTAVSNLVDSAPQTLDTLNELAAALGDDPNFATTVATQIGNKQDKPIDFNTWYTDTFGSDGLPTTEATARTLSSSESSALNALTNDDSWEVSNIPAVLKIVDPSFYTSWSWTYRGTGSNSKYCYIIDILRARSGDKYWRRDITIELATTSSLAAVATSGSYNDLTTKPTIPTAATTAPLMDGTAAVGSSSKYAKEDHVHPSDTSKQDKPIGFLGWSETYFNDWQDFPKDEANARELTSSEAAAIQDIHENAWNKEWCFEYGMHPMTYSWNGEDANIWTVLSASGDTVGVMSWVLHYNSNNEYWFTEHQSAIATTDIFATVATSGSYNDLTDKPTIPAAVTVDSSLTGSSQTNPVQGGAIYSALQGKEDRQIEIINWYYDGGTPVWTDSNGNSMTITQVNTLLRNANKNVIIKATIDVDSDSDGTRLYHRASPVDEEYIEFNALEYNKIYWLNFDADLSDYTYLLLDEFGGNELSNYVPTTRKINNKPLSTDITLTASDVGADVFVVTITSTVNNGTTTYSADKTNAEIYDAWQAGRNVVAVSNSAVYQLSAITSYSAAFFFHSPADWDTFYLLNITTENNTQSVSSEQVIFQDALVSGTNIKTINNQSLLGSGNISIANGNDGVGIASVVQTTTSTESGGNNVITVTKTDNSTSTFVVKNGVNGTNGVSLGDVALTQTTGSDTSAVMSQAAVTESLEEYSQKTNFRQVIDPSQAIYTKSTTESIKACTSLETYPFDEILKVDVVFRLTSGGFPNYFSLGNMCSIYLDSNNYIQWRIDAYNCYAEIKTDGTFQLQYTSKIDSGTPRLNSTTRFAFAAVIDLLQKKMSVYGVDSGSMVTIYSVDISSYDLSAFVGQQVKLRTTLYSYNKEYYNIYIRINKMLDLESDLTRTILASGYNAFPSYAKASNFSYGSYINGLTLGGTVTQTITSTHKKVSATNVSNTYFAIAPKTSKNFASSNLYWSVNIKLLSGSISIAKSAANAVNAVYIYDSSGSRVTTIEQDETYLLLVGALVANTNYSFLYGLYVTGTFELEVWNPNLFNAQTQNLCSETWDGNCFTGIIPFSGNPMFSTATAVGSIKVVNGNLQMWNGVVWKQINNS